MLELNEDKIRESLRTVLDPELFVNIIDLGLVYRVDLRPYTPAERSVAEVPSPTTSGVPESVPSPTTLESTEADTTELTATGEKHDILIEMTLTSPACPAGPQLIASAKNVVAQLPGVGAVEVRIVMEPPWSPDRMTEEARDQLGIF